MSRQATFGVAAILLFALIWSATFVVTENELALRTQFREIVGRDYKPGLHFKLPIDTVVKFEKRIISQSFQSETFLTSENQGLIVDFYVNWRIRDAGRYFESFGTSEDLAGQRLADIVKDGIKNAVAQRTLEQIVSAERAAFTGAMFGRASQGVGVLGLELVDVRVQRIDLSEEVASRVYASMQQSFDRLAKQYRGEGEKQATRIRAEADRRSTEILSSAERDALRTRGDADAQAARIYAQSYGRNPEFYSFYRSLQAYKNSLAKDGDVLVVSPDSDFFKYLRDANGAASSRPSTGR